MTIYNPNTGLYYNLKTEKWVETITRGCVSNDREELQQVIEINEFYFAEIKHV